MFATGTLTLDELIALNDEIVALSRAGVPLDRGLKALSRELPGRLGAAAGTLGHRLEAGQGLEEALRGSGNLPVSPAYLAVVRAGVQAGRLPVAVEGLASAARRIAQLRRNVGLALIYPAMILAIAYVLLIIGLRNWIPTMIDVRAELNLPIPAVLGGLQWLGETWSYWAPWPPVVLLLWLVIRWSNGTRMLRRGTASRVRSPRKLGILALGRLAAFAEVLGLLVEHRVPLVEALPLAGEASGDRSLAEACRTLSEQLRRGESAKKSSTTRSGLPPLVGWLVTSGRDPDSLAAALRRVADSYRTRARDRADLLAIYLPLWLTVGVGGAAVGLYAVLILAPWCRVLTSFGEF